MISDLMYIAHPQANLEQSGRRNQTWGALVCVCQVRGNEHFAISILPHTVERLFYTRDGVAFTKFSHVINQFVDDDDLEVAK